VLHAFVLGEQNVLGMSKAIPANDSLLSRQVCYLTSISSHSLRM